MCYIYLNYCKIILQQLHNLFFELVAKITLILILWSHWNPTAINRFLNWLFESSDQICSSWILRIYYEFIVFLRIQQVKTITDSLEWCKLLDVTSADSQLSWWQIQKEKMATFFLPLCTCTPPCQKVEEYLGKSTSKTPAETFSLASVKFNW